MTMRLSRLDLPPIVETIRELHRTIECPPAANWQAPTWLVKQYKQTTLLGEAGPPNKPSHAWLINAAAVEVLNKLMPPWHHESADCPEITESLLDQKHKVALLQLRTWLMRFALGQEVADNRSYALQALSFLEEVLEVLGKEPPAEGAGADRHQGGAGQAEGATESAQGQLKPSREKAYGQFQWAMGVNATLETDRQVYDWLKERQELSEDLVNFASWSKYLREARAHYENHKHTPRTARKATGKSVVRPDQI
jgi:hypothetical protein